MSALSSRCFQTDSADATTETTPATSGSPVSPSASTAGLWDSLRDERLQWLPELGIGWYPVTAQPYDAGYWEHYRELDRTASGAALTALRIALVARHYQGAVVDVGVGGGRFVSDRGKTLGFDVNPHAIAWLRGNGFWCDPYLRPVWAISCWDAIEHIHDPGPLLANVREWVFVSVPIFTDAAHALASKHFKPAEHCWYFTEAGLVAFMRGFGFELVERNTMEQDAGREGIGSYAFRRVDA